jgi:multiple sugar transport system substrate-binding protein
MRYAGLKGHALTKGLRRAKTAGSVFRSWLLLFIMLLPISFGCGQEKGVKLTFWQFWPSDIIVPIIAEFEKANPGIKVEMQQLTWQNGFEKIVAAVSSGTQPDLCELGSTWVPRFAADGVLTDITEHVKDLEDDYLFWESCTLEGRVYGVPWVAGTRVLFYNKELFRRAGLDPDSPPTTWEELIHCAQKVHSLGRDVYGFGMNAGERYILYKKFMPFAWGNGGRILSEDLKRSVFSSRENLDALRFYCSLKDFSLTEKQDVLDMAFKQGRLGAQISGGWNLRTIPADAPDLQFGVALVPRPAAASGFHASFAGSEILVTFVKSRHKEEALRLARFLISRENVISLCRSAKSVQPALKGSENDPYYVSRLLERTFVLQLGTAVPPPPHPRWVEIEEAINAAIEEAIYELKSPEDALKDAHEKIDEILSRVDG